VFVTNIRLRWGAPGPGRPTTRTRVAGIEVRHQQATDVATA
jgi:hypothetical protein